MSNGYIYKLVSPSGKVYIGQTIQEPDGRFRSYKRCKGTNKYFTNALLKYGFDSFETYIYKVPRFMLNYLERILINNHNSTDRLYGYNSRDGGGSRGTISDEQKRAISAANTGKFVSDETRERIRIKATGRVSSADTKMKLSLLNKGENNSMFGKKGENHPKYGKKATEETKYKLSLVNRGSNNPMSNKFGHLNPNSKKVYVYGNLYTSCIEASNYLKFLYPNKTDNFINTWTRSTTHPEIFLAGF